MLFRDLVGKVRLCCYSYKAWWREVPGISLPLCCKFALFLFYLSSKVYENVSGFWQAELLHNATISHCICGGTGDQTGMGAVAHW